MTDYKAEFEAALEARDVAGVLGTSPSETIAMLNNENTALRDSLKEMVKTVQMLGSDAWDTSDLPDTGQALARAAALL